MQIVCKDLKQHEMMVNELQDVEGEKNFFLADPGRACYSFLHIFAIFLREDFKYYFAYFVRKGNMLFK